MPKHALNALPRANLQHIDSILSEWKPVIGSDYEGYRNHVVRMVTFCLMLRRASVQDSSEEDQRKIEIAGCFHDIGLWTGNSLDYLLPSLPPARRYLSAQGLDAWADEIESMILLHHKVTSVQAGVSPLVELFRQGDLVDFSLGSVRFGLPGKVVRKVQAIFPNAGFHKMLARRSARWVVQHPLNPLPMLKW
ncbi:MAG: hypothetical protein HPY82_03800 [Gammaproteobacteria bacterium]|nr:hypothetical protein [Gammaproteobacteria bacterium]